MPRWLQVALTLSCISTAAAADPSAREILNRPDIGYGYDYLSGIADGINWANARLKDQPMFCPPQQISITQDQYREIISRQIEKNARYADSPATFVLLNGLISNFPCEKK